MEIIKEYIKDMPIEKQNEIRAEVERALRFFGYEDSQVRRMTAKIMDSTLADACNVIGAYKWALDDEQISADIICGSSVDAAIQRSMM